PVPARRTQTQTRQRRPAHRHPTDPPDPDPSRHQPAQQPTARRPARQRPDHHPGRLPTAAAPRRHRRHRHPAHPPRRSTHRPDLPDRPRRDMGRASTRRAHRRATRTHPRRPPAATRTTATGPPATPPSGSADRPRRRARLPVAHPVATVAAGPMNTDHRTAPATTSTALHTSDAPVTDPPAVPGPATAAEPANQVWTVEAVRALGMTTDVATAAAILGFGRTKAYE